MSTALELATATCDSEPIHIPGSVQPYGVLLVLEAGGARVRTVAGDAEAVLGMADAVGAELAALLGPGIAAAAGSGATAGSRFLGQVTAASGRVMDVSAFRSGPYVVVELEPASPTASTALAVLGRLEQAAAAFERANTLQALCEQAATTFQELTGFDRVMIYRFGDNEAGRVLGEARRPGMYSFLNHHFPASDIPQQARALYVRNLTRVIPDATYRAAPLRPAWDDETPLDLSDSNIRSVSPIHLEYLHNMGVRASASISIVRDGALWGLVACHHETPRLLPYDVRAACRALAGGLSRQIKAREEAESYRQRIRFRSVEDDMIQLLSREGTLDEALTRHLPQLYGMLDADGVAVVRGKESITSGTHPPMAEIAALVTWLLGRDGDPVMASSALSDLHPGFARIAGTCSGLLAVTLSAEEPWLLLWFRAEHMEVVKWAGNPHKAATGPNLALSPRTSFEAWQETVRGRSRRWSLAEVDSARRLRGALLDLRQTRRMRELNHQLTRLLQEQTRLVEQKDFLIGEVNHRVQNSLQLVSSFLQLQGRASDSPDLRAALDEAGRRLNAVALVHRRLYSGSEIRAVEADRYIEDLCADTLAAMDPAWRDQVSLDLSPVLLLTDRAVILGLVLTELVININKYAYGGAPGPIEVRLSEERGTFTLAVADRGSGVVSERRGFGSRMIDGLVRQIGGRIRQEDNRPGLRVVLTAPL